MAQDKETIIREIINYISDRGGGYGDWYVGIATEPRETLFSRHGVRETGDPWIYRECLNSEVARDIEYYFINSVRTAGGPGGGDDLTRYIYAYKIASHTVETA